MDKQLIQQIIIDQQHRIQEKIVERTLLSSVKEFMDTPFIIIISGIRRCGKSTLLNEFKGDNSYYVNFDDERFVSFTVQDFHILEETLLETFGKRKLYLFDEIQNIPQWERFIRRLHDERKKVLLTGSNATMLSRELGTRLTGRHISLALYPFSFSEFVAWKKHRIRTMTTTEKSTLKRLFNEYMEQGGFPEYLRTQKDEYLRSLYNNIIYRDIIARYNLPNEKALKEIVYFCASNIGKEISFNQLRKLVQFTSATTIREYLEYVENTFLAFLIPRYSHSIKKQVYTSKKVYFIDTRIAQLLGFRPTEDRGRSLENIIFLGLKRLGFEIYYHKETRECDFIVRKDGKIVQAIQVTLQLKRNEEREYAGLLEAMKLYKLKEGIIISEYESKEEIIEGKTIRTLPAWQWLLENEI